MKTNPQILILLATYNGRNYLTEQVKSLTNQINVDIQVNVSDDNSDDCSFHYLKKHSLIDSRFKLLPPGKSFGSAGRNFYRLILDSDFSEFDYVAFADQDDIWLSDKLSYQVELLKLHQADGVSTNVIAFWPDGKVKLINKAQPQREYDFLFESAGPGCTFLMTSSLVKQVKEVLVNYPDIASQVALHDWLTYAICRSLGKKWVIDPTPSVQYRQHSQNVIGANSGVRACISRFKKMTSGWYRQETVKITQISMLLSQDPKLKEFNKALLGIGLRQRFVLVKNVKHFRRSLRDRIYLASSILFGIF